MKIAIVTQSFYESTIPLFKYLKENSGYSIDLYCIIYERFLSNPGFDISCTGIETKHKFEQISNDYIPKEIVEYLNNNTSNINIYVCKLSTQYLLGLRNPISNRLKKEKYDLIHLIGFFSIYNSIISHCNSKFILSVHEANLLRIKSRKSFTKKIIEYFLLKNQFKIIHKVDFVTFFSNNEKNKFLKSFPKFRHKTDVVKFSDFETYKYIENKKIMIDNKDDYILFLGLIREYKGVNFLLDTIYNSEYLSKLKFVIAGKDEIGITNRQNNNVVFIKKFLTDAEIVDLIKNCKFLILPYTSASQSGLPCLALQFHKPFVFSDVTGLDEYLVDTYNGLKFVSRNAISLEIAIKKMYQDIEYNRIIENIKQNHFFDKNDWHYISNKFKCIYDKTMYKQ